MPGVAGETPRVLGWPPNLPFALLAVAAFLCCVTMSMPQNHLVALCTDLGYSAQSGAAMLSLLLGLGVLGRQIWGAISDRIGALSTLLLSSALQGLAMVGFVVTQGEFGLYAVSAAFGIGFAALIPAYVLAVREYYPSREASWRVPVVLLLSGSGMATGTWLAGAMYDSFGFYAPAFAAGVVFNLLNFIVIATLVLRRRYAMPQAA
jgi:predicted MFS family arabinose efflux permease